MTSYRTSNYSCKNVVSLSSIGRSFTQERALLQTRWALAAHLEVAARQAAAEAGVTGSSLLPIINRRTDRDPKEEWGLDRAHNRAGHSHRDLEQDSAPPTVLPITRTEAAKPKIKSDRAVAPWEELVSHRAWAAWEAWAVPRRTRPRHHPFSRWSPALKRLCRVQLALLGRKRA